MTSVSYCRQLITAGPNDNRPLTIGAETALDRVTHKIFQRTLELIQPVCQPSNVLKLIAMTNCCDAQAACQQARDARNNVAPERAKSGFTSPFATVQTKAAIAKQPKRSMLFSCFAACFGKSKQTTPWCLEEEAMPKRRSSEQSVDWVVGVLDGHPAMQHFTTSSGSTSLPNQLSNNTPKLRGYSSEKWFDALSTFGSLDLERSIRLDDFLQQQSSQQLTQALQQSNQGQVLLLQRSSLQPPPLKQALSFKGILSGTSWPNPPLVFCPPGLHFVPVPTSTGFAGYWDQDAERSTPHPLPSDVLARSSFIVQVRLEAPVHNHQTALHV